MKKIVSGVLILVAVIITVYYVRPLRVRVSNISDETDLLASSHRKRGGSSNTTTTPAPTPTPTGNTLTEYFDTNYSVEETGNISESGNSKWWINSGAYFYSENGLGRTVLGELSSLNAWRVAYNAANSEDTDNGYHPQNIFRLLSRSKWQNQDSQVYFQIKKDNLSTSTNRNQSNGLLLMTRYVDSNNLYYVGVRVDGTSIIKKKIGGVYYTLSQKQLPGITGVYNVTTNPNMLPHNSWIGLRSVVTNKDSNTVNIKQYIDFGKTGNWTLVADINDTGSQYGASPHTSIGFVGLRTDFMDVVFDDFKVTSL
jgi:hypothetical protein